MAALPAHATPVTGLVVHHSGGRNSDRPKEGGPTVKHARPVSSLEHDLGRVRRVKAKPLTRSLREP